jgi:hypothetical protein
MKIYLVKNSGDSFAGYVTVDSGITVGELVCAQMGGADPDGFKIRVNREEVGEDFPLNEGDRVTITPSRIDGAI